MCEMVFDWSCCCFCGSKFVMIQGFGESGGVRRPVGAAVGRRCSFLGAWGCVVGDASAGA